MVILPERRKHLYGCSLCIHAALNSTEKDKFLDVVLALQFICSMNLHSHWASQSLTFLILAK
jgi:hypothetical protein